MKTLTLGGVFAMVPSSPDRVTTPGSGQEEDRTMATFLMFGKYSTEAVKQISPARTEKTKKLVKQFKGEVKGMYALLGEYDLLFIAELPGAEQAMQFSVALSKLTGIAFTTSPAVTVAEFDKLMAET
jgi:uncharacterized protein with GYD domain